MPPFWNYWRVTATSPTAPDGSSASVSMNIQSRTPGKTTVAAEVKGLASPEDSAHYKALFKQVLADFAAFVAAR